MQITTLAALIASSTSLIITGVLFYWFLRKEKAIAMIDGELKEEYKDYELLTISGKQLMDFKKRISEQTPK